MKIILSFTLIVSSLGIFTSPSVYGKECDLTQLKLSADSAARATVQSRLNYDAALYNSKTLRVSEDSLFQWGSDSKAITFHHYLSEGRRAERVPLKDSDVNVTVLLPTNSLESGAIVQIKSLDTQNIVNPNTLETIRPATTEVEIERQLNFFAREIGRINSGYEHVSLPPAKRVSGKPGLAGRFEIIAQTPKALEGNTSAKKVRYLIDVSPWKRQMIRSFEIAPV